MTIEDRAFVCVVRTGVSVITTDKVGNKSLVALPGAPLMLPVGVYRIFGPCIVCGRVFWILRNMQNFIKSRSVRMYGGLTFLDQRFDVLYKRDCEFGISDAEVQRICGLQTVSQPEDKE